MTAAARAVARRRRLWLVWGVVAAVEIQMVLVGLSTLAGWPEPVLPWLAGAVGLVAVGAAVATVPAVRARTEVVLRATISVAGLTALVAVVYAVVVLGALGSPADDERDLLLASMVAAGLVGLLYVPTRRRVGEAANRLVYGEAHAPDQALRTFGSRMSRAVPMDELLLQLVETLRKSMSLERAEVWTGTDGVYELAVSVPHGLAGRVELTEEEQGVTARAGVSGPAWIDVWVPTLLADRGESQVRLAPAAHGGRLTGWIAVQRPASGDAFTEEEESVLAELGRQVGLSLHNVELDSALKESLEHLRRHAEELRESRARVVAAGDAERRKIERNLHDGAQQHLVALAVQLRLARDAVADDPDDAGDMLAMIGEQLQDAIQELRALAHGIYPPLLRSGGLTEALPAAAARSPLPASVTADAVGRYPTEVEAAVYFCCVEAVQNAGKHAGEGATITIDLRSDGDRLRFRVADDGCGFAPDSNGARGAGFVNMADRLGAVGGEVDVRSTPGEGTEIIGWVPTLQPTPAPAPPATGPPC